MKRQQLKRAKSYHLARFGSSVHFMAGKVTEPKSAKSVAQTSFRASMDGYCLASHPRHMASERSQKQM